MERCYRARVEIDTGWEYIKETYFCFCDNEKTAKDLIEWEIEQHHAVEVITWLEFYEITPCGVYCIKE